MTHEEVQFLSLEHGQIAVRARHGTGNPGLVWLSGYRSDMLGAKAVAVDSFAAAHNLSCLRFDYSGHGESGGDFFQGCISRWLQESLKVFETFCKGPQILVGSSMGGWIALRMAQELRKKNIALAGLVLIAPAPDFTHDLIQPQLTDQQKRALDSQGYFEIPSEYGPEPTPFTKILLEDGEENRVMRGLIDVGCPVHILQGMQDKDVPYHHTLELLEHLPLDDVTLTLIRDGDHRLSRPQDLASLDNALSMLIAHQRG
ncbi:alpha/beta hydrolase [Bartonella sp. LJL80]